MNPFVQYKPWMIERYGVPLFRVPVQLASSCPHGRCAFCSENGSKAQQTQQQESPSDQIEAAIKFSKRRYKAQKLMLYIQAFTADLTDPAQQNQIFQCLEPTASGHGFLFQGLENLKFEAISIGTRPDCLPPTALDFLEKLKEQVEVWVELGVQTANDETLKTINRGHDWECSKQAIMSLAGRGIYVAPHVILGLPNADCVGEQNVSDDWRHTAEELAKLPLSGIKIHNLHIMKGTEFAKTLPPTMNHWEYAEGLIDFLRRIPADIPVMRISTDTPKDQLIAPHWHLEKGQFLDYVIQQMTCRQIRQGDLTNGVSEYGSTGNSKTPKLHHSMTPVPTGDGSITFFSKDWKEHYHTKSGARLEADKKFVEPSGLKEKLQTSDLKLLDVCFGLGNNSLAALCAQSGTGFQPVCSRTATASPQTGRTPVPHSLDITALEMDKRVVRAASEKFQTLETDPVNWKFVLSELLQHSTFHVHHSTISLQWGDARWLIQNLADDSFDIVFHDPFSSQHCPELWTVEFFQQLLRVMKPDGVLLTYSSSMPVRGAMCEAGFYIAETVPGYQMGNGTIASLSPLPEKLPMIGTLLHRDAQMDKRRSIPYRDPHLCATSKAILRQRQETQENSR